METNNKIELYLNENLKEEQIRVPMFELNKNNRDDEENIIKMYELPKDIGKTLLDFIQNDPEHIANRIFQYYGFRILLTEEERTELLHSNSHKNKEVQNVENKLYSKYQKEFESYKKQIIDIIEYCLFNEKEELKDLTPLAKLDVFIQFNSIEEYPILKHNRFSKVIKIYKDSYKMEENELVEILKDKDNSRNGIQEIYEIDNFYNLLFLELYFILQEKIFLKKCKNCGRYFLTGNSAVIYCNNKFEDNKTCREIGASKVFIKNLEKDEAYNLYRKIYKKKQALAKSKGGIYEMDYNMFKKQGKDKKNAYKLKEITKDEFMGWLNKENE